MKNLYIFFIILFIPHAANCQTFDTNLMHMSANNMNSLNLELTVVDLNGDGAPDVFCRDSIGIPYTRIFMNLFSLIHNTRTEIVPGEEIVNNGDLRYAFLPRISPYESRDTVLFCSPEGQIKAVRYIDDYDIFINDRYKIFSFSLILQDTDLSEDYDRVNSIYCSNVIGDKYPDLLVIASNHSGTDLLYVNNPFDFKNEEQIIIPTKSVSLPGIPSLLFLGSFNGDNVNDLFFEFDRSWHVWLAHASNNVGYGFDLDSNRALSISIPSGAIKAIDITESSGDYPLFVGVETEADSDIAFVAFPLDDFNHPAVVSIPDKHLLGNNSRLFTFHNANTGEESLFCIVYSRLDENDPQPNSFSIFKIDPDDPAQPELIQTFTPDALNGRYYDCPMLMDDFNSDGISDLIITWADPSSQKYGFSGFAGLGETAISDWSVYE